jgi:hypothetical protein
MDANFSNSTSELFDRGRECAIEINSDRISTIHLLLADCLIPSVSSLKDLLFSSHDEFLAFYEEQKKSDGSKIIVAEHNSLPITIETEKTIRRANKLFRKFYKTNRVEPYQIFLSASDLEYTFFLKFLKEKGLQGGDLRAFYSEKGLSVPVQKSDGLLKRFFSKLSK